MKDPELIRARWSGFKPARACVACAATLLAACLLLLLLPRIAYAQQPSPTFDPTQVTIPQSPPSARAGAPLFAENCAPCHGDTGLSDGPTVAELIAPPPLFADPATTWEIPPAELFHTTKFGRMQGMMPPWRNRLDDQQIWDAVAYAWSLHTSEQQVVQGEALYLESCAGCHGASGAGDGPDATEEMASLADPDFVLRLSQADLTAGWLDAHPEIGGDWSSDKQAATLEYIRTFSLSPAWASPYEPGSGVIRGVVTQGTPDAILPTTGVVTLDAFLGFEPVASFTTTLEADGAFTFSNLSQDPNLNYIATVGSDGISYSSDFLNLSPITPTLTSEIRVFATTDDPAALEIDRFHWIVESQPGALLVGQVYAVGNTSDRTFVGRKVEGVDEPVTFAMHLPPAAQNVAFDNGALGDRFQQVGPVIYDTLPVVPGAATRQIIVRYVIPIEDSSGSLGQDLLYPTRDATLLVGDLPGLKVEATGLQFDSIQNMGESAYQLWSGADLEPSSLDVSFEGLLTPGDPDPRASAAVGATQQSAAVSPGAPRSTTPPMEPWVAGLIAGLVTAVLAGVTFWAWNSGRLRLTYSRGDLASLRSDMIAEIAHLDDLHALGDLTDNEWLRQRALLKTQLMDVEARLQRRNQKAVTA